MSQFAFDSTGINPNNRILNEPHKLNTTNGVDVAYYVPEAAPFFGTSMVVVDADTGDTLRPNQDYTFGHEFHEATSKLGTPIYGSVIIRDPSRSAMNAKLTYQTLGGDFVTSTTQAISDGMAVISTLGSLTWNDIAGLPPTLPSTHHYHTASSTIGWNDIVNSINNLGNVFRDIPTQIKFNDIVDLQSEFVTPLMEKVNAIKVALETLKVISNGVMVSSGGVGYNTVITPPGVGTAFELPFRVTVPVSGTYRAQFNNDTHVNWGSNPAPPGGYEFNIWNETKQTGVYATDTQINVNKGDIIVVKMTLKAPHNNVYVSYNGLSQLTLTLLSPKLASI